MGPPLAAGGDLESPQGTGPASFRYFAGASFDPPAAPIPSGADCRTAGSATRPRFRARKRLTGSRIAGVSHRVNRKLSPMPGTTYT